MSLSGAPSSCALDLKKMAVDSAVGVGEKRPGIKLAVALSHRSCSTQLHRAPQSAGPEVVAPICPPLRTALSAA